MTPAANSVDVRRYTQEYERLRSQVNGISPQQLFATPSVRGIGLALLLRDGLPAWMQALRQVLSQAAASAAGNVGAAPSQFRAPEAIAPATSGDGSGVSISSSPLVEPARQRDVTALLASLVLSARRTIDAASMKEPNSCR
jgi:hypothetical protein